MSFGFNGKKVLITGGLGFIGSNLAISLLNEGAEVTLVDSLIPEFGGNLFNIKGYEKDLKVNISDVRDEHSLKFLLPNQDYIFNLAGQTSHLDSMSNPQVDLEINVRAQISILETLRKVNPGARIVFASTRQVYGRPQYLPVDEKHPLVPVDVNGINKLAGEWYHLLYASVHGLKTAVLRLTNTYGPRMRVKDARQTFLGIWFKRLLSGENISVFGDGTQKRDFNYVDDVVQALLLAATTDQLMGKVVNLGGSEVFSLLEVAKLMVSISGKAKYELQAFPPDLKKIDIGDYYGTFEQMNKLSSWEPKIGFKQGIEKTYEYYSENLKYYL